eukprot:15470473-Alexandrium_andersonii.AAC.1
MGHPRLAEEGRLRRRDVAKRRWLSEHAECDLVAKKVISQRPDVVERRRELYRQRREQEGKMPCPGMGRPRELPGLEGVVC